MNAAQVDELAHAMVINRAADEDLASRAERRLGIL